MHEKLKHLLQERHDQQLYRSRYPSSSPQDIDILYQDKKYLSFCSNNYLGLANHPKVKESFKQAVDQYGVGSGASHLLSGHSIAHHALEEELAAFTGYERVLLFSTGYMANIGVITALLEK